MALKRDPSLIPLSHDHHHGLVRVFEIRQALRAGQGLEAQANETRRFFRDELVPHFRAEEEAVFPAIGDATDEGTEAIARLIEEHAQLRAMIDSLDDDAERLGAFADLLERHIRSEERELFAVYQEHVTASARSNVERDVRRLLNRPDEKPRACQLPGSSV